ncbi:ABC transporter permease [Salinispira pacifica]|uniref:ABC transmembrane type-1 domain-containing protein n=1 Tax=Salinispira pacifica TaxID=1307761 RepID=V5WKF9_9SPIO|nr:ABC transporter permease subunit [Salinispira pacifica]AHC15681.1 hypothetical protein L21SP2_2324 [Salinispira pacifica]
MAGMKRSGKSSPGRAPALFRIIYVLFFLLPLFYLLVRSFAGVWSFPSLLPDSWSVRAWRYFGEYSAEIFSALGSSVLYSFTAALLSLAIALFPARVLARRKFRGRIIVESLMLAPLVIPALVFTLGIYPYLLRSGTADSFAAVAGVLAIINYPYMLRSLTSGFESYGPGLDTAARMLGAGMLRRLRDIHLPQLLPAILAGATVVFLASFTEYFVVFLVGGGRVPSFAGYLLPLLRSSEWSISSLMTLMFLAIPLALYAVLSTLIDGYYRKRGISRDR